ncbi:WD40-repeat-containing domain protein [Gaertneriomyces semiglobifer]|nr:WD40-repeat-containing domain protein [Gaertneriomyces semiglobifer]
MCKVGLKNIRRMWVALQIDGTWMSRLLTVGQANLSFIDLIHPPDEYANAPADLPDKKLVLEHVFGYSVMAQRSNYLYLYPPYSRWQFTVHPAGNKVVITPVSRYPTFHSASSLPPATPVTPVTPSTLHSGYDIFPEPMYVQHDNAVTAICIHPNGGIIASAERRLSLDAGPVVRIWALKGERAYVANRRASARVDVETEGIVVLATIRLPAHIKHVPSVAFLRDGALIGVATETETGSEIRLYDWRKLDGKDAVTSSAVTKSCSEKILMIIPNPWSRRHFTTIGVDHMSFWTLESPLLSGAIMLAERKAGMTDPHGEHIGSSLCAVHTRHRIFVSGTVAGDIVFWKMGNADVVCRRIHKGPVMALTSLSHTSLSFISGSADSRILLWNSSHQPISELAFNGPMIRSLEAGGNGGPWFGWGEALKERASRAFSRTSMTAPKQLSQPATVLVGCSDGSAWAVSIEDAGRLRKTLIHESHSTVHDAQIWGLAPHPTDSDKVASAGEDGWIRLWSVRDKCTTDKHQLGLKLRCCGWSTSGDHLAVGTLDGAVHVLTGDLQDTVTIIKQRQNPVYDVHYSPNGAYLAVATHDGVIDIYAVDGETPYQRIMCCKGHSSFVTAVDWSDDSLRLQSNSGSNELMFWSMAVTPAPPQVPFSQVKWATTMCPLSWMTKGVYNSGSNLGQLFLQEEGPAERRKKLMELLKSNARRSNICMDAGCVLGLREVVSSTRHPVDQSPFSLLATTRGDVHILRYPACATSPKAYTINAHAGPVAKVAVSHDGQYAFSIGSDDGCLVVYRVVDAQAAQVERPGARSFVLSASG